jgi:hypothetical protein
MFLSPLNKTGRRDLCNADPWNMDPSTEVQVQLLHSRSVCLLRAEAYPTSGKLVLVTEVVWFAWENFFLVFDSNVLVPCTLVGYLPPQQPKTSIGLHRALVGVWDNLALCNIIDPVQMRWADGRRQAVRHSIESASSTRDPPLRRFQVINN